MNSLIQTIEILSAEETTRFMELEATIAQGINTFITVGKALIEIQDKRLYRTMYPSFEEYAHEQWGISRQSAYQYISAAKVVQNLEEVTTVLPSNEAQARELAKLDKQEQQEVWLNVVENSEAKEQPITAKAVREVVKEKNESSTGLNPAQLRIKLIEIYKSKPYFSKLIQLFNDTSLALSEISELNEERKENCKARLKSLKDETPEWKERTAITNIFSALVDYYREELRAKVSAIADTPQHKPVPPMPVMGDGLGQGKVHKISAAERIQQEESIAELRERPTQLEHQILLGEVERLKKELAATNRPHSYQRKELTYEALATAANKIYSPTIKDKMSLSIILRDTLLNDGFVVSHNQYTMFFDAYWKIVQEQIVPGIQPMTTEQMSSGYLSEIIQEYFPVKVDASEDKYMNDVVVFKHQNRSQYLAFSEKAVKQKTLLISLFYSNSKPNDLSDEYLGRAIEFRVKDELELKKILSLLD